MHGLLFAQLLYFFIFRTTLLSPHFTGRLFARFIFNKCKLFRRSEFEFRIVSKTVHWYSFYRPILYFTYFSLFSIFSVGDSFDLWPIPFTPPTQTRQDKTCSMSASQEILNWCIFSASSVTIMVTFCRLK